VHPGFIATERMALHAADQEGLDLSYAAPPVVCGRVTAWLADDPTDNPPVNGTLIESQQFCAERNLVPEWTPPARYAPARGS